MQDRKNTTQQTIFGRANGYFLKYSLLPNRPGKCSAGRAKKPPKAGPKTDPILHTRGISEKALGSMIR